MATTATVRQQAPRARVAAARPPGGFGALRLAHIEVLLVLLVGVLTVAPLQKLDANQASRYALTGALVERQTVRIDGYRVTLDHAERDGHSYSDKAPGQPVLAIPAEALYRALGGRPAPQVHERGDLGLWVSSLWSATLPALVLVVLAFRVGRRYVGERPAALAAGAMAVATPLLPFSSLLFGHVLAAALACGALALLAPKARASTRTLAAAGFLAGLSVAVEYTCAVVVIALGILVLLRAGGGPAARIRAAVPFAVGLAPAGLAVAAYHSIAFGGPFHIPYERQASFDVHRHGLFGVSPPKLHNVELLLVGQRGLVTLCPVLALAVAGLVLLWRRDRALALASTVGTVGFLAVPAGWTEVLGGASIAPRYVLPGLAFLVIPLALAAARWPRLTLAAAAWGLVTMTFAHLTTPLPPPSRSLRDLVQHPKLRQTILDPLLGASAPVLVAVVAAGVLALTVRAAASGRSARGAAPRSKAAA